MVRKGKLSGYSMYDIYEDGRVFSHYKGRFLKPTVKQVYYYYARVLLKSDLGYYHVFLIHRLVLTIFVCPAPAGMECHHKDHNKLNNRLDNLEWVTHSENILRSYNERDGGRSPGFKHDLETIRRMSMAKEKPVSACMGGEELEFGSVSRLLDHFGMCRRRFNRLLKEGKLIDGWKISFK